MRPFGERSLKSRFWTVAVVALVYFGAGKLGLHFAAVHPNTSAVWPASGVSLAAVLLFGWRVWPGIFAGAFLVNLQTSGAGLVALAIAAGNTLEGLLGGYLVERFNGTRRGFDRPSEVGRFVVFGGLVATLVAATIGTISLWLGGLATATDLSSIGVTWWLGDAVGVLVFAPLLLLWADALPGRWTHRQAVEALTLFLAIALIGQVVFGGWLPRRFGHYPLDFLCIPMLVWVAFRFGQREVATAVLVLSTVALAGTLAGSGPFADPSREDSLLWIQGFLGFTAAMSLLFASIFGERRRDHDTSARLAAERSVLLAREQAARTDAETANRAKDEFLAILSHELRTPLNAVYGWARLMQIGQLDSETSTRALDAIVRNANAQVQLIDDLLDVSRVINGKMRLELRPIELAEVVEAAIDAIGPAAAEKNVDIEVDLDPLGGLVVGDPGRLQQVVWNLVANAVKFTPAGGHVRVATRCTDDRVQLVVRDTGEGIAADVLPLMFDRFWQWDSSSTRSHSGLGLGLALVKHLTELHRGTVSAESAGPGQGAAFTVTLPLAVPSRLLPSIPVHDGENRTTGAVRLDGLRVLTVDDDPDALELSSTILSEAGATVRSCRSAAAALELLQAWRPDVLISDIEMPEEDGYSLMRKVRALSAERGGRTPAVALSAYGRTEDRVLALSSGYSMHVPKPVDPEEFTTIVANVARILCA